jgi:integrase
VAVLQSLEQESAGKTGFAHGGRTHQHQILVSIWPAPTKSGHVEPSSLKKQHSKALGLAGVRPFVLYSLRHTFLTRLGESGCDAWTLARIAGHSSITISARYVHPSENAVLAAVDKMGGHKTGHSEELQEVGNVPPILLSA